jgi:protein-S-isoprenylcysteine O-methyltransferase Ste14
MSIWNKYFDWPPVWLLIFMAAAWAQAQVWNPMDYTSDFTTLIGRGAIVFGIILMSVSFMLFQKHRTSVVPKRTPNSIITSGPYKYSRNPIYVADAIVLIGYVLTLGSVISLVLVPAFAWVIRKRFINGEEVGIRAEFGQAYEDYCQQTRRWI